MTTTTRATQPWHGKTRPASAATPTFLRPGKTWRPLHPQPNRNNQPISIRRAIALAKEK